MGLFKKKKLYKITYRIIATHSTIIEAVDEYQALRKFRRKQIGDVCSIEEYKVGELK